VQDWGVRACVRARVPAGPGPGHRRQSVAPVCPLPKFTSGCHPALPPSPPPPPPPPPSQPKVLRTSRRTHLTPRRPLAFLLLHLHGRRPPTRSTTYTTRYRRSPFHGFLLLGEQVGDHLLSHASPNTLSTLKNPRNATGTCEDNAGPQLTTSLQRRPPPSASDVEEHVPPALP